MEEKLSTWKNSLQYGAITGLGLVVFSLILFFLDLVNNQYLQILSYAILIAGIVYGSINLKNSNDNFISYSAALGSGTLIGVFASIIIGFYTYVFYIYIDPDAMAKTFEMMEQGMLDRGMSQDQIEMSIEMSKNFMSPLTLFVGSVLSFSLYGFVFSLITSIFVKSKNPN